MRKLRMTYRWDKEENFEESKKQLIAKLLSDEKGLPYKHFDIKILNSDYDVDWEKEKIIFTSLSGPRKSISSAIHELGHLMIAPNENIGQSNWGMKNPYLFFSGISIDEMSPQNKGQLKTEAKVWAWQYLMECLAGFKTFGKDDLTRRGEAKYLKDGTEFLNDEDTVAQIAYDATQKELKHILKEYPNWEDVIRNRLKSIPLILKQEKILMLNEDDIKKSKIVKEHICDEMNEGIRQTITLYAYPKGWYEVILHEYDEENKETLHYENTCLTRNLQKADKFFQIAVSLNSDRENEPVFKM